MSLLVEKSEAKIGATTDLDVLLMFSFVSSVNLSFSIQWERCSQSGNNDMLGCISHSFQEDERALSTPNPVEMVMVGVELYIL